MKYTCSTACLLGYPLRSVFSLIAEAGFDGVELVMGPQVRLAGLGSLGRLMREYQLPVVSVHQSLMRASVSGLQTRMLDAVRAARDLGADMVVLHGPGVDSWTNRQAQAWLGALDQSIRAVRSSSTRVSVENPGWYHRDSRLRVLGQLDDLMDFADQMDLAITLDTCHVGTSGQALLSAYERVRGRLLNVHLSDLRLDSFPLNLHIFRTLFSHHQMPGSGSLGLEGLVSRLKIDGYAGALCSEMNLVALHGWSRAQLKARLAQAAAFGK